MSERPTLIKRDGLGFSNGGLESDEYIDAIDEYVDNLEAERDRLREALERLTTAVENLPVKEWVEPDFCGEPELLGYVMRSQGEWDDARRACDRARETLAAIKAREAGR